MTICEDIWTEHYLPRPLYDCEPTRSLIEQGAHVILNLSASPFTLHKPSIRYEMVATLARTHKRPIFYCNAVGGNDQLIFDGNSIAVNSSGGLIAQLPAFREHEQIVDTESTATMEFREESTPEQLFGALSLGLRDYLRKCNFKSAVLGLSGGIDSAVVAVIAVEALGRSADFDPQDDPIVRVEAMRLRRALDEMVVEGIRTNIPLHQDLLNDEKFLQGGTSIHYLEQRLAKRKLAA